MSINSTVVAEVVDEDLSGEVVFPRLVVLPLAVVLATLVLSTVGEVPADVAAIGAEVAVAVVVLSAETFSGVLFGMKAGVATWDSTLPDG